MQLGHPYSVVTMYSTNQFYTMDSTSLPGDPTKEAAVRKTRPLRHGLIVLRPLQVRSQEWCMRSRGSRCIDPCQIGSLHWRVYTATAGCTAAAAAARARVGSLRSTMRFAALPAVRPVCSSLHANELAEVGPMAPFDQARDIHDAHVLQMSLAFAAFVVTAAWLATYVPVGAALRNQQDLGAWKTSYLAWLEASVVCCSRWLKATLDLMPSSADICDTVCLHAIYQACFLVVAPYSNALIYTVCSPHGCQECNINSCLSAEA